MYVRAFPFLLVLFWFSTPWSLILVNHGVTLMRRYGKLTATGRGMRTETPNVSLGRNGAITIPSAREISTVLQRHPHDKVQTFRHAGSHESVPELSRSFHSLAAVADMCQFLQRYNRSCENTSTFPSIRNWQRNPGSMMQVIVCSLNLMQCECTRADIFRNGSFAVFSVIKSGFF